MKTTIKAVAFLIAMSGLSSAASILISGFANTNFIHPETSLALDNTFVAKIGTLTPGVVLTSGDDFSSINANWTNAGDITFATGDADGFNGFFSGQVDFTNAAGLAGDDVFVWVTNGAGLNAVLRSTTTTFLPDEAIPNSNSGSIDMQTLTDGDWEFVLGEWNPLAPNPDGGGSILLNNVIPEPSAMLLGAFGALGLLRRRR